MQVLEQQGRLDRAVEFLPDDLTLTDRARQGTGLARPENAVLIAYAKLTLYDDLLASPIPDDPYLVQELERYFPATIRDRFPDAITHHKLKREIIATTVANAIVNRAGPSVVSRLIDETGTDAATIAAAYAAVRDSFSLITLNAAIDALDGSVSGQIQLGLYASLQDLLLGRMVWFIRNADLAAASLATTVARFQPGIAELGATLATILPLPAAAAWRGRADALIASGVPADLAARLAGLDELAAAPDIALVAERTTRPITEVAAVHFALAETFGLGSLQRAAADIATGDYYERLALDRAFDAITAAHRRLTAETLRAPLPEAEITRVRTALSDLALSGLTLSRLVVAAALLGDLARN
jgi:glutamate dehydrogenase